MDRQFLALFYPLLPLKTQIYSDLPVSVMSGLSSHGQDDSRAPRTTAVFKAERSEGTVAALAISVCLTKKAKVFSVVSADSQLYLTGQKSVP